MKLVQGKPEIEWWRAHPEHGLDWNAYRKLEQQMIKKGDLHALSDLHQAMDEDGLMEAYDARRMQDMENKVRVDRAKAAPLRPAEAGRGPSPREILKDPAFSGRGPSPWQRIKGPAGTIGLGLLMGLFDKQSEMAKMGRDEDYMMGPHLPWGGEPTNPYSLIGGRK